jgi:hypothetical protein
MPKTVVYKRSASKPSAKTASSSKKSSAPRSSSSKKKSWNPLKWFLVAAVVAAVPLTISLSQQSQDTRQRASSIMSAEEWMKTGQDLNHSGQVDIQDYNIYLTTINSKQGVALSLIANKTTVIPGEEFTVDVVMNTITPPNSYKVTGLEAEVLFDSTKLQVTNVTLGSFLPVTLIKPVINSGLVTFVVGSQVSANQAQGVGTVAQLTVRALAMANPTTISFGPKTSVAAIDHINTNVLGATNSLPVTISAGSVDPIPTPTTIPLTPVLSKCENADIDRDGKVTVQDYNLVKISFGKTGSNLPEDINRDGIVNEIDLSRVVDCIKSTRPTSIPYEIPVVKINTPANGVTVSRYSAIKIEAQATHSGGIQEMTLEDAATGKVLKRCVRTTKCTAYWSAPKGTHRIIAGATASSSPYMVGQTEITFTRP